MRVIKFRAWHTAEKKMYPVWGMLADLICLSGDGGTTLTVVGFSEVELMQFTGLLDDNGKEMYEGDVVSYWSEDATGGHTYKLVVKWNECAFDVPLQRRWIREREVIGNIYEHPDLFKGEVPS